MGCALRGAGRHAFRCAPLRLGLREPGSRATRCGTAGTCCFFCLADAAASRLQCHSCGCKTRHGAAPLQYTSPWHGTTPVSAQATRLAGRGPSRATGGVSGLGRPKRVTQRNEGLSRFGRRQGAMCLDMRVVPAVSRDVGRACVPRWACVSQSAHGETAAGRACETPTLHWPRQHCSGARRGRGVCETPISIPYLQHATTPDAAGAPLGAAAARACETL